MASFKQTYSCKGPRDPKRDEHGNEIRQLQAIVGKYHHDDGYLCYGVIYWEGEGDLDRVHLVDAVQLRAKYPKLVDAWENKLGSQWRAEDAESRMVWSSGDTDFSEVVSAKRVGRDTSLGESSKRKLKDSPEKITPAYTKRAKNMLQLPTTPFARLSLLDSPAIHGDESSPLRSSPYSLHSTLSVGRKRPGPSDNVAASGPSSTKGKQREVMVDADEDVLAAAQSRMAQISKEGMDKDMIRTTVDLVSVAAFNEAEEEMAQLGDDSDSESTIVVMPTSSAGPSQDGRTTYELYSHMLKSALDVDIYTLIHTALELKGLPCDGWVRRRKTGKKCFYEDFIRSLCFMVYGWDAQILRHFVHGDLPEKANNLPELAKRLRQLKNLGKDTACPSTYVQYLVDTKGLATTVGDLREILDKAELYIEGRVMNHATFEKDGKKAKSTAHLASNELAAKVDDVINEEVKTVKIHKANKIVKEAWGANSAKVGARRYIDDKDQTATCRKWIAATRARIEGLPDDRVMERALSEVGYATKPIERLHDHAKHTSSNYLMNLAEAICKSDPRLKKYSIVQYVVHHIIHYTHAMFDEILASRFALAYTTIGGGFSHHAAGISHDGAKTVGSGYYNNMCLKLSGDEGFKTRAREQTEALKKRAALYKAFLANEKKERDAVERLKEKVGLLRTRMKEIQESTARAEKEHAEALAPFDGLADLLKLVREDRKNR